MISAGITNNRELRSLQLLLNLYDKAAPIVHKIADIDTLNSGELPANPYLLMESNLTLSMILNTLKKMPTPKDKVLITIRNEFEKAIIHCLRVAEASEKLIEVKDIHNDRSSHLLSIIINSTIMAHEYIEEVGKKLEQTPSELVETIAQIEVKEEKNKEKSNGKEIKVRPSPTKKSLQSGIDIVADYIELGLDKLGDIITFPIELLVKLIRRLSK